MKLHNVDLYDAVRQHEDSPATFWVPDSKISKALKVGDRAKVACNGERFWVCVKKVEDAGEYVGRVDNVLFQKDLNYGMMITLSHTNIYDVMTLADHTALKINKRL